MQEEVRDDGVVAVVTGVNSSGGGDDGSIGYETAKRLVAEGDFLQKVVLAGRKKMMNHEETAFIDSFKRDTETEEERERGGGGGNEQLQVVYKQLDLSSFESIRKFVKELKEYSYINHLVHCDGVMFVKFEKTEDGFERHFQVNHLGPALLTLELHPLLKKGGERKGGARVVMVTSVAHSSAEFNLGNMDGELNYSRFMAYYNSKLYSLMFAHCVQRRFDKISVACVDPGRIRSNLVREACQNSRILKAISKIILKLRYEAVEVGGERVAEVVINRRSRSETNTANSEERNGMAYYHKNTLRQDKMSATAQDVRSQKRLWEFTVASVKKHLTDSKFISTEHEETLLQKEVTQPREEETRPREEVTRPREEVIGLREETTRENDAPQSSEGGGRQTERDRGGEEREDERDDPIEVADNEETREQQDGNEGDDPGEVADNEETREQHDGNEERTQTAQPSEEPSAQTHTDTGIVGLVTTV